MHISNTFFIVWIFICLSLVSCSSDEPPTIGDSFEFVKPEHFPETTYTFENNSISKEGFELGKRIFFDPILSRDNTIACASCHDQTVAFADPQHRLSLGVDQRVGIRNAPQLANLAFYKNFFWDGGVIHVDFVPLNAIKNPLEMDENVSDVIIKMTNHPEYPGLFKEVFGTDSVTTPRMLQALSQFMVMLVSANSAYDKYVLGEGQLDEVELEGLQLFESKCGTCHSGELFTDQNFRNNGLDNTPKDIGRALITEREEDNGKFRVPSLRNVSLTSPYMHDGRFISLKEVLDHYAEGVQESATLDPILINGTEKGISLTDDEKTKIIAFLETLTDYEFISESKYFKNGE